MQGDPNASDRSDVKYALKWTAIYVVVLTIGLAVMRTWEMPDWFGFVPVGLALSLHLCNHVRQRRQRRSQP